MARTSYDPHQARISATRRMINKPEEWPCWPRLPMKLSGRIHERDSIGCIVPGQPTTIYLVSLFEKVTNDTRTIEFKTVDDLIDAGWVVD